MTKQSYQFDPRGPSEEDWLAQMMVSTRRHGVRGQLAAIYNAFPSPALLAPQSGMQGDAWRDQLDNNVKQFASHSSEPSADGSAPPTEEFCWPVAAGPEGPVVTSSFGPRKAPEAGASTMHSGTDFRAHRGTPIQTPEAGVVIEAGPRARGGDTILVRYDDGSIGGFAHTGAVEGLKVGDRVGACTVIGFSNGSGARIPHLHYTYRPGTRENPATLKTKPVDPMTTQFDGRVHQQK